MTQSDKKFVEILKQAKKGFKKRINKTPCDELHAGCFDCQTQWMVGMINYWIDLLRN